MSVVDRRNDERGAVAVMFALLGVVVLSIAALSVDLGNTVARRTTTQTQADFAAFAAAQKLTTTAPPAGTPVAANVVTEVRDYLNRNQPQDDEKPCSLTTPATCVTSAHLTDGTLTNGEVRWISTGLQVVAPEARVDFGFAQIMGFDGTYVDADATVKIFSRGLRVMPMFAVSGCDYGRQTLTDPAGGHVTPGTPVVARASDTNDTTLQSASVANSAGTTVTEIPLNSTGNVLTLTGRRWDRTKTIGFFRDGSTDPLLIVPQDTFWSPNDDPDGPDPDSLPRTDLSTTSSADDYTTSTGAGYLSVKAMIPDTVARTEGVWWVRVFNGPPATGRWSAVSEARPIRVGGAVLECAAGSSAGNFGTLKLPRTDVVSSQHLPVNIAVGLQRPLTPTVHQWAKDNPLLAGVCVDGINGAVESSGSNLRPGTNCADTDTGLAANVATQGLITGASGNTGVMMTRATKAGCDPSGGSANRRVRILSTNYDINNDVLTCYLTDGSTSLATITNPSYNGPAVLDPDIFSAPRFIWVPVLATQPVSGGSQRYSIVDFRPAFITDEQSTSAAIRGSRTATADNGLTIPGNDITQIKVVFFDVDALPNSGSTPLIDYLGVGPKKVNLID